MSSPSVFWTRTLAFAAFLLAALPVEAATKQALPCAADPFADPRTDPCNPLKYIASNTLTAIGFALYVLVGTLHVLSTWKWGAKWMSAMTIGIFTFAAGLGCRFGLHSDPQSKGIYIAEYLFVILSPCAFIAADYVLLGRLSRYLDKAEYLWISPTKVTKVFVLSDVTTFLIQAVGGSVSIAANDLKTNKLGSNIFLAGLVLQLVSFLVFTTMYLRFLQHVYTSDHETWNRDAFLKKPWHQDWRALAFALFVSCTGIIIRSIFRVVELSQGFQGSIATNEGLFYGLDTLPLFFAVTIYVLFWPGRFIPREHSSIDEASDGGHSELPNEKPVVN